MKDLCARLPYGVKVTLDGKHPLTVTPHIYCAIASEDNMINLPKLLLRPMSSMTEEEYVYFTSIRGMNLPSYKIQEMMSENFSHPNRIAIVNTLGRYSHTIDWLNKSMFDYRGLIPKGLAIEVTKENNPYK